MSKHGPAASPPFDRLRVTIGESPPHCHAELVEAWVAANPPFDGLRVTELAGGA